MTDLTIDTAPTEETSNQPLSERVVDAVAEAEGVDPVALEPIYAAIEPDALDSLFAPQLAMDEVPDASAEVRFRYHGYRVRVTATGKVTLDSGHETSSKTQ